MAVSAAMWMAEGTASLLDWPRLTWSLGWTGHLPPFVPVRISFARAATTSFTFMLLEVPEPVWKTPTTNWSSKRPSRTSRAAAATASAIRGSSSPSSRLTSAAQRLISASARMKPGGIRSSPIGRFSTARRVWAP